MNQSIPRLDILISTQQWPLALEHIHTHPQSTTLWTKFPGFFDHNQTSSTVLPIHIACAMRPPTNFFHALLNAHTDGTAVEETTYGRLPIHIACMYGASLDVILLLLEDYPEGSQMSDSLGRIPLHYACRNGASVGVVRALLELFPGSARACDDMGWLPLHIACSVGANVNVVRDLLSVHPSSVMTKTVRGNTPLMCAKMTAERGKKGSFVVVDGVASSPTSVTTVRETVSDVNFNQYHRNRKNNARLKRVLNRAAKNCAVTASATNSPSNSPSRIDADHKRIMVDVLKGASAAAAAAAAAASSEANTAVRRPNFNNRRSHSQRNLMSVPKSLSPTRPALLKERPSSIMDQRRSQSEGFALTRRSSGVLA